MRIQATIVLLAAVTITWIAGCKTDTPGVKNVAGTYTASLEGQPDHVTRAARAAAEQLGLQEIRSNPSKVDGWVTARTAKNESVSIRVGVVGDDSISKRIFEKIRDNL